MKIINHIKAGARVAPALLIILYYLFIILDIYTTYLATPDLKYESNWMVRCFNLNWSQIIIKDSFIVIFMTLVLLIALNYMHGYFQDSNIKNNKTFIVMVFQNKKLLISYIILGTFYSHLMYTVFVTINNYLGYIYLYRIGNALSAISTFYLNKIMIGHPYFLLYIQLLTPIPGFIVASYKVKKIRNKYRKLSVG